MELQFKNSPTLEMPGHICNNSEKFQNSFQIIVHHRTTAIWSENHNLHNNIQVQCQGVKKTITSVRDDKRMLQIRVKVYEAAGFLPASDCPVVLPIINRVCLSEYQSVSTFGALLIGCRGAAGESGPAGWSRLA
jgi:hypothetical protein